jgi:Flp pilus assembly protein TadG
MRRHDAAATVGSVGGRAGLRRGRLRGDAGQSLAEMAMLLPLLLLMLLGVIDLGRLAYIAIQVTGAARAGVMYGAQSQATARDSAGMQAAAQNDSDVSLATVTGVRTCRCSGGTVDIPRNASCGTGQRMITYVTVTAAADYAPLIPYPGVPGAVRVTRAASMRVGQ